MQKYIYNKNPMLILQYISKNKNTEFLYGSKIASDLNISQGGVSTILKDFARMGIVKGNNVGKTLVYSVNRDNPLIKSFRIFDNIAELNGLVEDLKSFTKKIILFGSCASGEDTSESDIDLFILTEEESLVREKISSYETERTINPVIVSILESIDFEKNDPVFYKEIEKGIVLWGSDE